MADTSFSTGSISLTDFEESDDLRTSTSEIIDTKGNPLNQLETRLQKFSLQLKRQQISGSYPVAKEAAEILRILISKLKFEPNLNHVLEIVREIGKTLQRANPLEFAVGNIVRRILFIIREEHNRMNKKKNITQEETSLLGQDEEDYTSPIENPKELKVNILKSTKELIEELSNIYRNIADQALEHIHSNEVIMTYGGSKTIEEFLKAAGKKRTFEVIIAEAAPSYRGREMAKTLAKAGIATKLIPDTAIFAMMSRVNKVIVATHAVMANGGLLAPTGLSLVSESAKIHSVPFVVCTGLYKLSPLYAHDQDTFNLLRPPSEILKFEEADKFKHVHVVNPALDYVPPELISLYLTNMGGHNPSYIYRLLSEYYHPDDLFLNN